MPTYDIQGVPVEFPYDAYECQLDYMGAVVRALDSGENAFLESPTGTGKTLCLLCAALGWRRKHQHTVAEARTSWEKQAEPGAPALAAGAPRIWYSSRTHSQLKQVISELKKTSYRPWSVVLGSREHFCVHTSVSRSSGARQNAQCKRARDENRCPFYTGFRKGGSSKVNSSGLDIEEIVEACKEKMVCPYFKCREDAKEAELLLIPYDYLISPHIRESLGISFQNSILVFDEGHNIEKSCEMAASFELLSTDLGRAITEIDDAFDILESEGIVCEEALGDMSADQLMGHLNLLKRNLLNLEDSMDIEKLTKDPTTDRVMTKAPGSHILEIFGRSGKHGDGITAKDAKRISFVVKQAITVLTYSQDSTSSGGMALDKLQSLLGMVFGPERSELDQNYQVLVYEEPKEDASRGAKRKAVDFFGDFTGGTKRETPPRTLAFWCFSCSVTMKQLMKLGVRSLIVTSGTLSPLEGTKEAFGVPFPVVLESAHVIDSRKQVWGGVLSSGLEGAILDASFASRNEPAYLRDLGKVVLSLASFVPDGLLVAFNSYSQKDNVLKAWRQCGMLEEIALRKPLFDEPRGNFEMKAMMEGYNKALATASLGTGVGGAILTAVCRGKLCEGIDFTDRQCRMVLMVGIPYPNRSDLRVILKQSFLDRRGNNGDGRAWYSREAICAVNQTLGRVIRHKHDFGAVLLCDSRYAKDGRLAPLTTGLSKWLAPCVSVLGSAQAALDGCRSFFGLPPPNAAPAPPPERPKELDGQPVASGAADAAAPAARVQAQRSAATAVPKGLRTTKGVPLSTLGNIWKSLKAGTAGPPASGREAPDADAAGLLATAARAPAAPQVAVPAAACGPAEGPPPPAADPAPARQAWPPRAVRPAAPTASAASAARPMPPRAAAAPSSVRLAAAAIVPPASRPAPLVPVLSRTAVAWLARAQELLPRSELERVRTEVAAVEVQAPIILAGGVHSAVAEELMLKALSAIAASLLPEFNFDTPPEARSREDMVRDGVTLLPKLLRPLWKRTLQELLSARGDLRRFW